MKIQYDVRLPLLRIGFVDYFPGLDNFFMHTLSKDYCLVRDDINPQVLFFCDETFGTKNLAYDHRPEILKVFYTGENRRPQNYHCNFAVTFDHNDEPWHYRLPLHVIDHWMMVHNLGMPEIIQGIRSPDITKKTGFCGFVSGNPNSYKRNQLFGLINSYKKIDSAGPLFNNVPMIPRGLEAAKHKYDFLKKYKFTLCPENSSYPGYVTEKIMHAFYAGSIPIYWGDPVVTMDFNTNAFINWHRYRSDKIMLEAIEAFDNDDNAWTTMAKQEIYSIDFMAGNLDRFRGWFKETVFSRIKP